MYSENNIKPKNPGTLIPIKRIAKHNRIKIYPNIFSKNTFYIEHIYLVQWSFCVFLFSHHVFNLKTISLDSTCIYLFRKKYATNVFECNVQQCLSNTCRWSNYLKRLEEYFYVLEKYFLKYTRRPLLYWNPVEHIHR